VGFALDDRVTEILQIYQQHRDRMATYRNNMSEDIQFNTPGGQWTAEQVAALQARGQAALEIPYIMPQISLQKSQIIAKPPKFKVSPIGDEDNRKARLFNMLLDWVWRKSRGDLQIDRAVTHQLMVGKGYLYVGYDQYIDNGKGMPYVQFVHPLDVVPDPESRELDEQDSTCMFITRNVRIDRAKVLFPQYADKLEEMASGDWEPAYTGSNPNQENIEVYDEVLSDDHSHVTYIEYLKRVAVKKYVMKYNDPQGKVQERSLYEEEYDALLKSLENDPDAEQLLRAVQEIEETFVMHIQRTVILGDEIIFEEVLPTRFYPLVPIPYEHYGNPYCVSLTRKMRGLQLEVNARRSLMIAHAQASTAAKVLVPKGSVDVDTVEENWARPSAVIEFDSTLGAPVIVSPVPLPNALYSLEAEAKKDMEFVAGSFALSHGDSQSVGDRTPYRSLLAMDEYGSRRIGLIAKHLYYGLDIIGSVLISFLQYYLRKDKGRVIRITNPDEYDMQVQKVGIGDMFNPQEVDGWIDDPAMGEYDVQVLVGSMAPTNRHLELEVYTNAFQLGLIDDVEVLKKTDIFDRDGVLQRKGMMAQMRAQMQSMEGTIKQLQRDNEQLHDESRQKAIEVERAQADRNLAAKQLQLQAEYDKRMLDLENAIDELRLTQKEVKMEAKIDKAKKASKSPSK